MLLNKVVLSDGFGSIIHVGDVDGRSNGGVNIYHEYRLVYEIEGVNKSPAEMIFTGTELLKSIRHASHITKDSEGCSHPMQVKVNCQMITTIWAWLSIDNSKCVREKLAKDYGSEACRIVKKALKGDTSSMSLVKIFIGGYVLINRERYHAINRTNDSQNVLHILDVPSVSEGSEVMKDLIELYDDENWQEQPIVSRLGLTSFEEVKLLLNEGALIPSWTSDFSPQSNFKTI